MALVFVITGRVLGDQDQFFDPLKDQFLGFDQQVFLRIGNHVPADQRNGAIGTAVGAPFRDFQIGRMGLPSSRRCR